MTLVKNFTTQLEMNIRRVFGFKEEKKKKKMRIVKNSAAQGEMYIRRVSGFKDESKEASPENGRYILAHSETGHHHVIDATKTQVFEQTVNVPEGMGILQMIVKEPTTIEHLRSTDTHEPLYLTEGNWEIRLQREYTPEGYRRVAD